MDRALAESPGAEPVKAAPGFDLYVDVYTETPVSLNKKQREILEELQSMENSSNQPESEDFIKKVKKAGR